MIDLERYIKEKMEKRIKSMKINGKIQVIQPNIFKNNHQFRPLKPDIKIKIELTECELCGASRPKITMKTANWLGVKITVCYLCKKRFKEG